MLASPPLRVRARLGLAAAAVFLTGLVLSTAAPAGAQAEPTTSPTPVLDALSSLERTGSGRLDSPVIALLRAVHRAERAALATEPTERDRQAKAATGCAAAGPARADVPTLVAEIFRCRLREAGVEPAHVDKWAAEAVVVSHCESLWDTHAIVFDGRYRDAPHANGNRYSAAGVFQFIRATADEWIDGGYANVHDARRNIDAAARLFIHNRVAGLAGWEDWACVAANDGFKVGSVLAGWPGGPSELPEWAWQY